MYACWDSSRRGSVPCLLLFYLFSRCQPLPKHCQRGFFLYYSDLCPRSRGCPVLTHIDLSVSARHHMTRILVRSRWLLRVSAAARVSSCVCQQLRVVSAVAAAMCGVSCKFNLLCDYHDWSMSQLSRPPPVGNCPKSRRTQNTRAPKCFF